MPFAAGWNRRWCWSRRWTRCSAKTGWSRRLVSGYLRDPWNELGGDRLKDMFTGIVEATGEVISFVPRVRARRG